MFVSETAGVGSVFHDMYEQRWWHVYRAAMAQLLGPMASVSVRLGLES